MIAVFAFCGVTSRATLPSRVHPPELIGLPVVCEVCPQPGTEMLGSVWWITLLRESGNLHGLQVAQTVSHWGWCIIPPRLSEILRFSPQSDRAAQRHHEAVNKWREKRQWWFYNITSTRGDKQVMKQLQHKPHTRFFFCVCVNFKLCTLYSHWKHLEITFDFISHSVSIICLHNYHTVVIFVSYLNYEGQYIVLDQLFKDFVVCQTSWLKALTKERSVALVLLLLAVQKATTKQQPPAEREVKKL